ncbi:MAG: carboxypeptidase-like regulatory domain-containing protein [Polaribacter sp.]
MLKKIHIFLFFSFFTITFFAQHRRILINGKVNDSLSTVRNANVINLQTKKGTYSSDNGKFRVFVKQGDSLRVSTVQHNTRFFIINKTNISTKKIYIKLKFNTIVLNEFELKKNNLRGRLGIDTKSVPRDKKDSLLRRTMDFSKVNMNAVASNDFIDNHIRPPIVNTT